MEVPQQVRDKLAQYQTLQEQLQLLAMQKQQVLSQVADIERAQEALGQASGSVYKAAGPILVESTKDEALKELTETKETVDARTKLLEKQEKKLLEKHKTLREEIQGMLGQTGGGDTAG